MTVADIIYDIKEIKQRVNDDSDVTDMWLLYKINSYRQIHIQNEYSLNHEINQSWLQRIPRFLLTKVTAADDPEISYSSIMVAKGIVPAVISLPDDLGMYRVSGSSGILQLEPCDFNTLMMRIEVKEMIDGRYGFYSRIGNTFYCWPLMSEASAIIIAENPMDVPILENNVLRARTLDDDYPVDIGTAQAIILDVLTKDFAILERAISDTVNDAQSQFKIMNSGYKE